MATDKTGAPIYPKVWLILIVRSVITLMQATIKYDRFAAVIGCARLNDGNPLLYNENGQHGMAVGVYHKIRPWIGVNKFLRFNS